ncbi:MAG: hypothetical protein WCR02_04110 [Sphaerochaetaceae bacterium]
MEMFQKGIGGTKILLIIGSGASYCHCYLFEDVRITVLYAEVLESLVKALEYMGITIAQRAIEIPGNVREMHELLLFLGEYTENSDS